jgi:hypothetical protein
VLDRPLRAEDFLKNHNKSTFPQKPAFSYSKLKAPMKFTDGGTGSKTFNRKGQRIKGGKKPTKINTAHTQVSYHNRSVSDSVTPMDKVAVFKKKAKSPKTIKSVANGEWEFQETPVGFSAEHEIMSKAVHVRDSKKIKRKKT